MSGGKGNPDGPSRPRRVLAGARNFADPPLKIGRIPFGRTVLILELVAALTFLTYTLIKKDFLIPLVSNPYIVDVIIPDAQGLNSAKEPAAGVAGVPSGKVMSVNVEQGLAHVKVRLGSDLRGKVFNDATVFVRPTSVLQTLMVNIIPGNPATGPLPEGKPIMPQNTTPFVAIDDLTGLLDSDTQTQVQILIEEAATALSGREPELRQILGKLAHLTDVTVPVARTLAERRRLLAQLTDHTDALFKTLGRRGDQLASAIDSGSRTLEVTARRGPELADATREFAPALAEIQSALASSRALAQPLVPALDKLVPVAHEIGPTSERLRDLNPELDDLVGTAKDLVREGRTPVRQLAGGLKGLPERIQKDQVPALKELLDLSDLLYKYRNGLVQFADNFSGLTSTNRRAGTYGQFSILDLALDPKSFGLSASAAKTKGDGPSKLSRMLARVLEYTCRESNPAACLFRFGLPGLPAEPLLGKGKEG